MNSAAGAGFFWPLQAQFSSFYPFLSKGFALSTIFGACAFSFYWGVYEMFEQEKRVLKGWFPENPKRHDYYEAKRIAQGYKNPNK